MAGGFSCHGMESKWLRIFVFSLLVFMCLVGIQNRLVFETLGVYFILAVSLFFLLERDYFGCF